MGMSDYEFGIQPTTQFNDARHIFIFYMKKVWEKVGYKTESDNYAEWNEIFDCMERDIQKMIREEIQKAKKE